MPLVGEELIHLRVQQANFELCFQVDDVVAAQVRNGRSLGPSGGDGRLAVADESGEILAVYESRDGEFKAVKVLAAE